MMTNKHERQKCKHADECFRPCDCRQYYYVCPVVTPLCYEPVEPGPTMMICPDVPMVLTVSRGISHDGTKWEWELDFEPSCDSAPSKYVPLAAYDRLRDRLELAEQRETQSNRMLGIVTEERDQAREGESHWQRVFDRSVSMRTVLETEHNKARRELEAIGRQRDRLLSLGRSDNDVICRLRPEYAELETERDNLRHELEAMTRANEQPGGLVREAQAGTVFVGGEE